MTRAATILWSVIGMVSLATSPGYAACTQNDVYKLKQAGFSVADIRTLCAAEAPPAAENPAPPETTPPAASGQKLSGADIQAVLSGNTASGVQQDKAWRQYFAADGTMVYQKAGSNSSQGYWKVQKDQYCERWSAEAQWTCSDLFRDGETLIWRYASGEDWPARILPGKQLAAARSPQSD